MLDEHVLAVLELLTKTPTGTEEFCRCFRRLLELLRLSPELRAFLEDVAKDPTEKDILSLLAEWLEDHEYKASSFHYKLLNSSTWHLVVKVGMTKTPENEQTAVGLAKTLANTFKYPPPFTVLFSDGSAVLDLQKGRYVEKDYAYEMLEREIRSKTYGEEEAKLLAALRRCRYEGR